MSFDTPVVLIIFNRPATTQRVFDAIRNLRPSTLLVVADGPRNVPGEAARCRATRAILDQVDWDCELHTNLPEANLGLRHRFASAFEWVFERVEEAIFLEDDCVPHPDFFPYCAELLERHRDNPRVMWIAGTNPYAEQIGGNSYFFARTNWVWGWATWKRAWRHFDIAVRDYPEFRRRNQIAKISPYKPLQQGHLAVLELAHAGEWIGWDVQATFAIWNQDGVCIVPNGNLVTNIGFGEGATNTRWTDDPLAELPFRPIGPLVHPSQVSVELDYDARMFDAHFRWMTDYAKGVRYRKLPFYKTARRVYRSWRAAS